MKKSKSDLLQCVICLGWQPTEKTCIHGIDWICEVCDAAIKAKYRNYIEQIVQCQKCGAYHSKHTICFECDLTPDEQYACRENEGEPHPY